MPSPALFVVLFSFFGLGLAQSCTLTLPTNPLSATGLVTPFQLSGCDQTQFANQGTFVEAAIIDPATGNLSIYHPLVVNKGSKANVDFVPPVPITLPANAVVGLWFGTNAATLTLAGDTNNCVNGLGNSVFGQFAHCNAPATFTAAQKAIAAGQLSIPAPGTASKAAGQVCPQGTDDFRIVDQDQSDNVVTTYLLINGKKLAQNTPANKKANPNAEELTNGSDNALVNDFLQPIMGCTTFQVPSLTAPTGQTAALILNELVSQQHPPNPRALVPLNDPMVVLGNGAQSLQKVNAYRQGVGQPNAATNADADPTTYCKNFAASGIFIAQNQKLFTGGTSPDAAAGNNLFTFLAQRFATSFGPAPALGCQTIFGLKDSPIAQKANGNGVVTSASVNTAVLSSILDGQITAGGSASTASAKTTAVQSSSTTTRRGRKGVVTSSTASTAAAPSSSTTTKRGNKGAGAGATQTATTLAAVATAASSSTSTALTTTQRGRGGENVVVAAAIASNSLSVSASITPTVTQATTSCTSTAARKRDAVAMAFRA